ncbi:uncharacterized protein APUU_61181A [Aspergillus puulaauensis]|uniref:Uncharacterized protein n=1 Tax=Aspergillus puulaauensis TaxID=1220207 RepID=A0A7R8ASP0_9EURO|nr:uncharacterized protein APUU_61181A [Aspergillus puulaauensis]BCS28133.1 hypothetical protein APUU_61181A [Aspergillus puulaauensis]
MPLQNQTNSLAFNYCASKRPSGTQVAKPRAPKKNLKLISHCANKVGNIWQSASQTENTGSSRLYIVQVRRIQLHPYTPDSLYSRWRELSNRRVLLERNYFIPLLSSSSTAN